MSEGGPSINICLGEGGPSINSDLDKGETSIISANSSEGGIY